MKMEDIALGVITCTGTDLRSFEKFIEMQERNRVGWDQGFFKIIVDPSTPRQTPSSVILEKVTKNLKKVNIQHLLQGTPEKIYQYKVSTASTQTIERFRNAKLSWFSEETCCSQELKTDKNHLTTHFFSNVSRTSAQLSHDSTANEEKKQQFLKEGAKLRRLYENDQLESSEESVLSDKNCPCPDCNCTPRLRRSTAKDPILYCTGIVLPNTEPPILITKEFSLSRIKNILLIGPYYEGLTCPYFYLGTKHSFFPLHIEDGLLWSINYLHFGLPKVWIMIPPRATLLLNYHLSMSGLSLGNTSCWNILGHKTVFPSTQWLEERLIPYEVVVQNPGEAIVLYPNTAHYGFNTGWNLAEAVNFGTISWIPDGINAPKCQCLEGQIHLDMTNFVSAFMPDLLDKFLSKKFIETQRSISSISFFNESLKKLIEGGNSNCVSSANTGSERNNQKTNSITTQLVCPAPFCDATYTFSKSKNLLTHIVNEHRPIVQKCDLLGKYHELLRSVKKK